MHGKSIVNWNNHLLPGRDKIQYKVLCLLQFRFVRDCVTTRQYRYHLVST